MTIQTKVGITGFRDGEDTHTEVLTTGCTEVRVVSIIMVHMSLGQHGVVFQFTLGKRGAVGCEDDQLGYIKEKET